MKEEYKFTIAGKIIKYLKENDWYLTEAKYFGFTAGYKPSRYAMFRVMEKLYKEYKITKRIKGIK